MSFEIITDSSANLPETLIDEYGLHVMPLVFNVKGQEYLGYVKGETIDLAQFYRMMREKENITTSLLNIESCTEFMRNLLEQGKDILYIGFSSGLSGSYQVGDIVAKQLQEEFPERKIYTVDTLAAALGEGLLVYLACQKRKEGCSIEEVYQWVVDNRLHLCHWFTVDDLFFLKRGGRVSQASAIVGSILSIKPVMHVDDEGHLIVMEKVRGRRKSLDALVKHMEETVIDPENQHIFISHGDCLEDAQYVEKLVRDKWNVKDVMIHILDPVIGAHSGPGTVALFFVGTKR